MNPVWFDINFGIQVFVDERMQAQFLVIGCAEFAQIKGDHIGKTHFVGKV